jgi:hypothetical protein
MRTRSHNEPSADDFRKAIIEAHVTFNRRKSAAIRATAMVAWN